MKKFPVWVIPSRGMIWPCFQITMIYLLTHLMTHPTRRQYSGQAFFASCQECHLARTACHPNPKTGKCNPCLRCEQRGIPCNPLPRKHRWKMHNGGIAEVDKTLICRGRKKKKVADVKVASEAELPHSKRLNPQAFPGGTVLINQPYSTSAHSYTGFPTPSVYFYPGMVVAVPMPPGMTCPPPPGYHYPYLMPMLPNLCNNSSLSFPQRPPMAVRFGVQPSGIPAPSYVINSSGNNNDERLNEIRKKNI